MLQLESTSARKWLGIPNNNGKTIFRNESARFICYSIFYSYFTRQNDGAGFFSCRDEFFFTNNWSSRIFIFLFVISLIFYWKEFRYQFTFLVSSQFFYFCFSFTEFF